MGEGKGILFSIVIPCYNYEATIKRAISSVLLQSGHDFELLVIDDGSTDSSLEVIKRMCDDNVRFLSKENGGLASTRNRGIDETTGKYLIFLDADDEMAPNALSFYRENLVNADVGMLAGGHISKKATGEERVCNISLQKHEGTAKLRAYLLDKTLAFSNGAVAISRRVFDVYRYPESFRSNEDVSMFAFILVNFEVKRIQHPLAIIHKHADSLRHNVEYEIASGVSVVDEVFDTRRIPNEFQCLKGEYLAQRCLSIFRTLFLAGDYSQAREYYYKATITKPAAIFRMSYLLKFIRSFLK